MIKNTLLKVIQDRIKLGSKIIFDSWKASQCLKGDNFQHFAVNQSVEFISSTDAKVKTQKI